MATGGHQRTVTGTQS
ncbi:hypothetical protein LINGRAHAP2_LOCUS10173 [Linum grandiflorum]